MKNFIKYVVLGVLLTLPLSASYAALRGEITPAGEVVVYSLLF